MKYIVVIVGSKNDLSQCTRGLDTLREYVEQGRAQVTVHVASTHRHTEKLLALLKALSAAGETDIIIAGAGKAAALPGLIDAYLRNKLGDGKIQVIGVAFMGKNEEENMTAVLSITQVPGTQVIYAGQGAVGFHNACLTACQEEKQDWPAIELAEIPPDLDLTLEQAYQLATA